MFIIPLTKSAKLQQSFLCQTIRMLKPKTLFHTTLKFPLFPLRLKRCVLGTAAKYWHGLKNLNRLFPYPKTD